MDVGPLFWMRGELLTNQPVKSGRRIGRQAHIKATADSAVLHIMIEIPPSIPHTLIQGLSGPDRCYSPDRGFLTMTARAMLMKTPLGKRKS